MNNIYKYKSLIQNILIITYIILLFIFSIKCLESGDDSTESSKQFAKMISELFNVKQTNNFNILIRKLIGHFLYFGIISIISTYMFLSFDKLKLIYQILLNYISIIIFILFSEFILQSLAINRNPSFRDCFIDFLGFFIGSISIYIYYFSYNYVFDNKLYNDTKKHLIYTIIVGSIYLFSIILFIVLANQGHAKTNEISKAVSEPVVDIGSSISGTNNTEVTNNINTFVRKLIGHFSFLAEIGFFSCFFYYSITKLKKIYLLLIHLIIGITFSYGTEFVIEKNVYARTPSINDFHINTSGFISITILFILISSLNTIFYRIKTSKTY